MWADSYYRHSRPPQGAGADGPLVPVCLTGPYVESFQRTNQGTVLLYPEWGLASHLARNNAGGV